MRCPLYNTVKSSRNQTGLNFGQNEINRRPSREEHRDNQSQVKLRISESQKYPQRGPSYEIAMIIGVSHATYERSMKIIEKWTEATKG